MPIDHVTRLRGEERAHRVLQRRLNWAMRDREIDARARRRQCRESNNARAVDETANDALPGDDTVRNVFRDDRIPGDDGARRRIQLPVRAAILVVGAPIERNQ